MMIHFTARAILRATHATEQLRAAFPSWRQKMFQSALVTIGLYNKVDRDALTVSYHYINTTSHTFCE